MEQFDKSIKALEGLSSHLEGQVVELRDELFAKDAELAAFKRDVEAVDRRSMNLSEALGNCEVTVDCLRNSDNGATGNTMIVGRLKKIMQMVQEVLRVQAEEALNSRQAQDSQMKILQRELRSLRQEIKRAERGTGTSLLSVTQLLSDGLDCLPTKVDTGRLREAINDIEQLVTTHWHARAGTGKRTTSLQSTTPSSLWDEIQAATDDTVLYQLSSPSLVEFEETGIDAALDESRVIEASVPVQTDIVKLMVEPPRPSTLDAPVEPRWLYMTATAIALFTVVIWFYYSKTSFQTRRGFPVASNTEGLISLELRDLHLRVW